MQKLLPNDRSALIELVAQSPPTLAVGRACVTGKVEVYGGFRPTPPGVHPGFILCFTTEHGRVCLVSVIPRDYTQKYEVSWIDTVPWRFWAGDQVHTEEYSIYRGDHPGKYALLKESAS